MSGSRIMYNICRIPRSNVARVVRTTKNNSEQQRYATNPMQLACTVAFNRFSRLLDLQKYAYFNGQHQQNYTTNVTTNKPNAHDDPPMTIDLLWKRLESHYKKHGYLDYALCQRLVLLLPTSEHHEGEVLSTSQALFLLSGCVPELLPSQSISQRLDMFKHIWQYASLQKHINLKHYYMQLQTLRLNELPLTDFREFLNDAIRYDVDGKASPELYSAILDVACSAGHMRQASELLAAMRENKIALNEHNFNALILGHGRNHDLKGLKTVLESMTAAGVPVSNDTFTVIIISYLENEKPERALEILNRFRGQFEARHLLQILRTTMRLSIDDEVIQLLIRELPKDYVKGPEVPASLRSLCIEMVYNNKLPLVRTIIDTLPKPEFNDNQNMDTYGGFLLPELFRAHVPVDQIIDIAKLLSDSGKNKYALQLATEYALRRNPDVALEFFKALARADIELHAHFFWPLIKHNLKKRGESGVLQTLSDMTHFNVYCDKDTISQYVLPNIWVTLEQPKVALEKLDNCGVRTVQVLTPIIDHLLQQHKIDDILHLCELYPTRLDIGQLQQSLASVSIQMRVNKNFKLFGKLVAALNKKTEKSNYDFVGALLLQMLAPQNRLRGDTNALLKFVEQMSVNGLKVSPSAIEAILGVVRQNTAAEADKTKLGQVLHKMRDTKLSLGQDSGAGQTSANNNQNATFIKHPRDMSLEELECHLIELESKQLNTRGVLRRLLQLYVRENKLEQAVAIKEKCDKLKVQTSPGMIAAIFDMYVKLKDLSSADATLKQMGKQFPGFVIDEHKLIDYAALLVHDGKLDEAMHLLEKRAQTHKISGGDYVLRNVWNLLNNVALLGVEPESSDKSKTREVFDFLREHGYCKTQNALLGPLVRDWLLRGDIKSAVAEFCELAEQYKHTPLQFELLSLLVRLSNDDADELEKYAPITSEEAQQQLVLVTSMITRIHGQTNMNSALLLALAESGTEQQLRRLMLSPEFRINDDLLAKNCEHLSQEGAVKTLLNLARGSRGLPRVIDEHKIYNMLLHNFAKTNNCDAALDLYERLDADDELKVSQEFMRNLVNLLKVNNVAIPSNIALRAQVLQESPQ